MTKANEVSDWNANLHTFDHTNLPPSNSLQTIKAFFYRLQMLEFLYLVKNTSVKKNEKTKVSTRDQVCIFLYKLRIAWR